jgi:hypothetical protein
MGVISWLLFANYWLNIPTRRLEFRSPIPVKSISDCLWADANGQLWLDTEALEHQ